MGVAEDCGKLSFVSVADNWADLRQRLRMAEKVDSLLAAQN